MKDEVYRSHQEAIADFTFGEQVASVFDNMLDRSVPFYSEIQRMIGELAADFAVPESRVYDLGCSTGTTLIHLDRVLPPDIHFVGLDNSEDMLKRCKAKLNDLGIRRPMELRCADLNQPLAIENASLVLMVLTLQFIRPLHRDDLLRTIYAGLRENGCLILVEKVLGEESLFNRLFIQHYYEMKKRNGYSELEISQKREALENVLIPYKLRENRELLTRTGFRQTDVFFKWYNFAGLVAVK